MSYISPSLNFLITTIKKSANTLIRDFNEVEQLQSSVKGPKDFVIAAIGRINRNLQLDLQKGKPTYAFVIAGQKAPAAPHFLVSPLDGVLNFVHGIPHFAVSVAMVENDVITAAVVYNPISSELYFAEQGKGAYREGNRNHERLRVSSRKEPADAMVATNKDIALPVEFGYSRDFGAISLDLAYVAAGRMDVCIGRGATAAELAAGILLVKEAGGYVYELNQKDIRTQDFNQVLETGNVIASNANLAKKVYELLNK